MMTSSRCSKIVGNLLVNEAGDEIKSATEGFVDASHLTTRADGNQINDGKDVQTHDTVCRYMKCQTKRQLLKFQS